MNKLFFSTVGTFSATILLSFRRGLVGNNHTWAKGGGRGECIPPSEGQKQVLSPVTEKWVPITKNPWSFLWYTPFLLHHFYCTDLTSLYSMLKKVENWWECKNFFQKNFFSVNKKIVFPLHPPFTQAMAVKKITSPEGISYPCTHRKKIFPLCKKIRAHVWKQLIYTFRPKANHGSNFSLLISAPWRSRFCSFANKVRLCWMISCQFLSKIKNLSNKVTFAKLSTLFFLVRNHMPS